MNIEKTASSLNISNEVIESIIKNTIADNENIKGLGALKNSSKSIKVEISADSIKITVAVIVTLSCKLKSVCESLQEKLKDNIQTMTGITVSKVNIYVSDVK
ncbi:MAG: Asp23/Gls24 family envelope stress response protein [Oscillospiraceae bacterium]